MGFINQLITGGTVFAIPMFGAINPACRWDPIPGPKFCDPKIAS